MFYFFFIRPINVKTVLLYLYLEYILNIMFLSVCLFFVFENRVHLVPRISALWIPPKASLWLIQRVWTAGGWSSMTTAIQTSPSEFVTLSALITVMTEASLKSSTWQPFIISKIHRMTYTNIQSVFDKSACIYLIKYIVKAVILGNIMTH